MARGLRWQPFVVAAGLLAPPVVLAVAVWPASAAGGGADDTELAVGDEATGTVGPGGVTSFEITATEAGRVRIDVLGGGSDPTLTLLDDDGNQLDYNDDADGLDPSLQVDLDDGEVIHAEVRSFGGDAMAFTIRVREAGGLDDPGDGDIGTGPTAVPAGGPVTTVPGDGEGAFEAPLGDEPIEVDGPDGVRITLHTDAVGQVCIDAERADGGSSSCGGTLRDLRGHGGFGGSFDGG